MPEFDKSKYGKKLSNEEFYKTYYSIVAKALEGTNVSPELAMAQLAKESGWGRTITPDNNFAAVFGKKHGSKQGGTFELLNTHEDIGKSKIDAYIQKNKDKLILTDTKTTANSKYKVGDKYVDLKPKGNDHFTIKIKDKFTSYPNFEAAIKGYGNLLTTSKHYKDNFYEGESGNDPLLQIKGIGSTYATGTGYTQSITDIINDSRNKGYITTTKRDEANKPNFFLEKNDDGTTTAWIKGSKSDNEFKTNEAGDPTSEYKYSKYNNPDYKYPGYLSTNILFPPEYKLMNLGDRQYILNPTGGARDEGTLMALDYGDQERDMVKSNDDWGKGNLSWLNVTTDYQEGIYGGHVSVAQGILKAMDEYSRDHKLQDGKRTDEENKKISQMNNLLNLYVDKSDFRSDDFADDLYTFQQEYFTPYYKNNIDETVAWSKKRYVDKEDELAQAIQDGESQETITKLSNEKNQYQNDFESIRAEGKKLTTILDDTSAGEKRTKGGDYSWYVDLGMWLDPGSSPSDDYNITDRGNKLVGSSKGEKMNMLNLFGEKFKAFSDATNEMNKENVVVEPDPVVTTTDDGGSGSPTYGGGGGSSSYSSTNTTSGPELDSDFTNTMDHVNDIDNSATVTESGEVVVNQKSLKDLQDEMALLDDAINASDEQVEQVGAYIPDSQSNLGEWGSLASDAGKAILGMTGAMKEIPEYETGEMYNMARDEMIARRDLGMSAEEKAFSRNLAERGYGYDVKNIRRLAGGNAGVALGNLGRAQSQLYDQYTNIAAADQSVRRGNRQQFYAGAGQDEMINRQKFQDELSQTLMDKQAGAGLVNDALSNISNRGQFNKTYGKGSPYYEMMKSTWETSEQERINKSEALKTNKQKHLDDLEKQKLALEQQIDERLGSEGDGIIKADEGSDILETQEGSGILSEVGVDSEPFTPFETQEEGDSFRTWMQENHPDWRAEDGDVLDPKGGFDNQWINEAKGKYGAEFEGAKESIAKQNEDAGNVFNVSAIEAGYDVETYGDLEGEMFNKYGHRKENWDKLPEDEKQIVIDQYNEENKKTEQATETDNTYTYGKTNDDGEIEFTYGDKTIKRSDMKNDPLPTNVGDGNDYIRKTGNFENSMGGFDSQSMPNYGFTGTGDKGGALLDYYNEAEGENEGEKYVNTVNQYIVGEDGQETLNGGNTTILQDLGITREEYDKLPDDVKEQLVDYKLNSGRGATDLVAIAGGNDWDGNRAYSDSSPTSDDIGNVDLSTLSKDKLIQARQDLYQGRIDGLQAKVDELGADAIEPNSGKTYGALVNEAQKGYDNSQKYRAGGQDVKEEATNVATGEEIMDELSDDNTGSSIVESVTDEKITETGEESGSNIVESITEENVEEEKVSREDQTWEDKLNDYKSEFKDEETLKRYEEDPIAFVEEDIAGWESEEDSDEKTQSLKNLRENLEILKVKRGVEGWEEMVDETTTEVTDVNEQTDQLSESSGDNLVESVVSETLSDEGEVTGRSWGIEANVPTKENISAYTERWKNAKTDEDKNVIRQEIYKGFRNEMANPETMELDMFYHVEDQDFKGKNPYKDAITNKEWKNIQEWMTDDLYEKGAGATVADMFKELDKQRDEAGSKGTEAGNERYDKILKDKKILMKIRSYLMEQSLKDIDKKYEDYLSKIEQ